MLARRAATVPAQGKWQPRAQPVCAGLWKARSCVGKDQAGIVPPDPVRYHDSNATEKKRDNATSLERSSTDRTRRNPARTRDASLLRLRASPAQARKIGRASCRERV